tara:strand:+ start:302 stop:1255 length:954 start_codon:yes stop_codon:yes gene_type:complete
VNLFRTSENHYNLQHSFYSNGKLLLSGEYLVLNGASAIALPLKLGQDLQITSSHTELKPSIHWKSFENTMLWFEMRASLDDFSVIESSNEEIAEQLKNILVEARKLNEDFLTDQKSYEVKTQLNFDRNFGFGTSSTLIANIAEWAQVGPYSLLEKTFGGSGYDIACAKSNGPILFKLQDSNPIVKPVSFDPAFKDHLYFIYLGKKQNSAKAVQDFKKLEQNTLEIMAISELSKAILEATSLSEFQTFLLEHEFIISKVLGRDIVKEQFPGYEGVLKSLGAWGGDFILAATHWDEKKLHDYFQKQGLSVIFKYQDLVK